MEITIDIMVEVFKTDVRDVFDSELLIGVIQKWIPNSRVNFDLDDCDNILRVEGEDISPQTIITLVTDYGYTCEMLL